MDRWGLGVYIVLGFMLVLVGASLLSEDSLLTYNHVVFYPGEAERFEGVLGSGGLLTDSLNGYLVYDWAGDGRSVDDPIVFRGIYIYGVVQSAEAFDFYWKVRDGKLLMKWISIPYQVKYIRIFVNGVEVDYETWEVPGGDLESLEIVFQVRGGGWRVYTVL